MIKRLILLVLVAFISTSSIAGSYLCTGFFISADGYIGTAGHCVGKNMTAYVVINGDEVELPFTIIAVDRKGDVMIGKVDVKNHSFFLLDTYKTKEEDHVAYIGYPEPDVYGFYKHHYHGIVRGEDALQDDLMDIKMWSRGGTSGSCIYDSNSVCVGILTEGIYFWKFFVYTGMRPVSLLVDLAIKHLIPVNMTYSTGQEIDDNTDNLLFERNKDKVVLIMGESDE